METSHGPLANYTDLLLDAICLVDGEGRFIYVSAACESIFGYTQQEMVGLMVADLVHPDDREETRQAAKEVRAGHTKSHFENRYIRKDGQTAHIMWSARWSEADQLRIAVARDITAPKHAESMRHALYAISEASHATEDLWTLFQRVDEIVSEQVPAAGFSIALHDGTQNSLTFLYGRGLAVGVPDAGMLDSQSLSAEIIRTSEPLIVCPMAAAGRPPWTDVGRDARYCLGVPLKAPSGRPGALLLQSRADAIPYTARDVELLQFVAVHLAAAMERVEMQARLRHMALYDHLTGLPNRQLLHDRLATALERARRQEQMLALLYIDLDKLKQVNDALGHEAGDRLLQVMAERLAGNLRATDTVARLAGDEFAVLLEGIASADYAYEVAEKVQELLIPPVELGGLPFRIGASIGVALFPEHGRDERELLVYADCQMYTAKRLKQQN